MDNKDFLNFYASYLREIADKDYIHARTAHRTQLFQQFQWSSLQCLEKYIKIILLYNRISSKNMRHSLIGGLSLLEQLNFFVISNNALQTINHFDRFGTNRYGSLPYYEYVTNLTELDRAVFEIRRYCKPLDHRYSNTLNEITAINEQKILSSPLWDRPLRTYIQGGWLESILKNKNHPARASLIWNNPYFLTKIRKKIKTSLGLKAYNSPLSLYPEFLDEITQYILIPKGEIDGLKNK